MVAIGGAEEQRREFTENGPFIPGEDRPGMNGCSMFEAEVEAGRPVHLIVWLSPSAFEGGYRFDRMALPGLFDILWGSRLRSMSGPIMAESQQERKARHSHVVQLPEKSAPEE